MAFEVRVILETIVAERGVSKSRAERACSYINSRYCGILERAQGNAIVRGDERTGYHIRLVYSEKTDELMYIRENIGGTAVVLKYCGDEEKEAYKIRQEKKKSEKKSKGKSSKSSHAKKEGKHKKHASKNTQKKSKSSKKSS